MEGSLCLLGYSALRGVWCIGQVREGGRGKEGTGGLMEGSLCLLDYSALRGVWCIGQGKGRYWWTHGGFLVWSGVYWAGKGEREGGYWWTRGGFLVFAGLACGVECIGQVRGRGGEGTGGLVEGSLCLLG